MPKTILITGTSTGFGRDAAETLALAGHHVFASMRDIAGRNRAHADALGAKGIQVVELDVTDDASVDRVVNSILAQGGRLDVLINNAGIGSLHVTEAFTTNQVRELFEVNVIGIQRMMRAVLPSFRSQREGLVVNIGSILGRVTIPFRGLYGASKFAVEALTDSYRYELSQQGIDVVLLQPGPYPTSGWANLQIPGDSERIAAYGEIGTIPGRIEQTVADFFKGQNAPNPREVAEAITQLLEQPNGLRPARLVVGNAFGADVINDHAAVVQAQLLEAFGLAFLAKPPATTVEV